LCIKHEIDFDSGKWSANTLSEELPYALPLAVGPGSKYLIEHFVGRTIYGCRYLFHKDVSKQNIRAQEGIGV
jgi:hypothetical protein